MRVVKIIPSKISAKRWIFAIISQEDGDITVFDALSLTQAKKLLAKGADLLVQWDGKLWKFEPDYIQKDSVLLGRMIAEVQ